MCQNYEDQLVRTQQREKELEQKITSLERIAERYKEDLSKESSFRKDMEVKWNEKKEEHKLQVISLYYHVYNLNSSQISNIEK